MSDTQINTDKNPFGQDDEQLLAEFITLDKKLSSLPLRQPGRITFFGWDIEYVSGPAVLSNVQYQVLKRINDFYPDNDQPVILDLGANIGLSVLNYKRHFPAAQITAFEPDPVFLPVLRRNLESNGASDVKIVDAAAWISDGNATWLCEGIDGSKLISAGFQTDQKILVRTVDLAQFLDTEIDLIKMDIEGAEYEVIPHLAGKLKRVKNLTIECHFKNDSIKAFSNLLEILADEGFSLSINSYSNWRDLIHAVEPDSYHYSQYLLVSAWRKPPPAHMPSWRMTPNTDISLPMEIANLRSILSQLNHQYLEIHETLAKSNELYWASNNDLTKLSQQYQELNHQNEENLALITEIQRQNEENLQLIRELKQPFHKRIHRKISRTLRRIE